MSVDWTAGYECGKRDAVDRCMVEKGAGTIGCNPDAVIDRCIRAIQALDVRHSRPTMPEREASRSRICNTLDIAHAALRAVDASDQTQPQTDATCERVSLAVDAVERMAREMGFRLSEMRGGVAGQGADNQFLDEFERSTDRARHIALARNCLAAVPDSYTEDQINDVGRRARHWVTKAAREHQALAIADEEAREAADAGWQFG